MSSRGIDPCCGTGRFIIDALVHNDTIMMHGVDLDIWMLRCAMLNVRMLAKWTSLRLKDPEDRLKPLHKARNLINAFNALTEIDPVPDHMVPPEGGGNVLLIGGRSIFMHGDALTLDLNYTPNWLCAGWAWSPKPWRSNLKIEGYPGTYDAWERAGRPAFGEPAKNAEVQFDYSMDHKKIARPTP